MNEHYFYFPIASNTEPLDLSLYDPSLRDDVTTVMQRAVEAKAQIAAIEQELATRIYTKDAAATEETHRQRLQQELQKLKVELARLIAFFPQPQHEPESASPHAAVCPPATPAHTT